MKLYLASRSPRRQQLLQQIGVQFQTIDVEVNEDWDGLENPQVYVVRMAIEKAQAGKELQPDGQILAADTSVVLDNRILGKAETREQARHMLQQLSGRIHQVYTAVALYGESINHRISISQVSFKSLEAVEIQQYIETDEPIGKAGGYAIQGQAAVLISNLEGSYSGVMGLPLFETNQLLLSGSGSVSD